MMSHLSDNELDELTRALHMLHEQAHGDTPWRTCVTEPCNTIGQIVEQTAGPAPLTLAGVA